MSIAIPTINPIARIAIGLVALLLSLLMVIDMVFGLLPDRADFAREIRQQISEGLAIQSAALLQVGDIPTLQRTLSDVLKRNEALRSLAVRRHGGEIVARAGEHERYWHPPADGSSTVTQVRVPVLSDGKPWGEVELAFRPVLPESLIEWLAYPPVVALLTIGVGAFLAFYLYMRRVLEYLDPSTAIPDRVRTAFDTLSEGVLIMDKQSRVVLANRAFRALHPQAQDEITGKPVIEMEWLVGGFHVSPDDLPWSRPWHREQAWVMKPLRSCVPGKRNNPCAPLSAVRPFSMGMAACEVAS
ncbi:MAG: PAS domain-containing protein [Zoogloea sp.]|nr:PAS domain-containing protein [Zoogloea sp.]